MELYDRDGHRKYLTGEERNRFEAVARTMPRETRTFCLMLLHSGCRISEVLNMKVGHIDFSGGGVIVESLKKRKKGIFRKIPLPPLFLDELNLVHDLKTKMLKSATAKQCIWNWSRTTGFRRVDQVMKQAGINGVQACPKGLRHGFAIACLEHNIPLPMVQKWLGHSALTTTAIYVNAVGEEEINLAKRLWTSQTN